MHYTRWLFSAVWLIVLLHLPPAFAMQRDFFPTPNDYSVRMPGPDGRAAYHEVPVAKGNCSVLVNIIRRIEGWQRPPDRKSEPNSIIFQFRRVDDEIKVGLSVVYPVR